MDLTPFVDQLRRDLLTAADAGGEEARALAERLTAPLESSVRLALLSALSQAAEEITGQLAPGAVDVRLRGSDLGFAVTHPPAEPPAGPAADAARARGRRPRRRPGRGRHPAHHAAAARAAEGPRRRGGRAARRLGQHLARPGRRQRHRAPSPGRRPTPAAAAGPAARSTPAGPARPAPPAPAPPTPADRSGGTHPCPEEGAAMPTFDTPGPITARIEVVRRLGPRPRRRPARHRRHRPARATSAAPPTSPPPSRRGSTFADGRAASSARPAGRGCCSSASGPEIDVDVVLPDGLLARRPHDGRGRSPASGRLGAVRPGQQVRRPAPGPAPAACAPAPPAATSPPPPSTARPRRPPPTATSASARPPGRPGWTPATATSRVDRALASLDRHAPSTARCASARRSAARWCSRPPTARSRPACARGRRPGSTSHSGSGRIRNLLTETEGPEGADETVEIHARTSYGDILIRRA